MVERLKPPEYDEAEQRLLRLETLREWGIIDEDEYQQGKRGLADTRVPVGRAWELRAEVRAYDRRSRGRRR
jgi:hypothetical protein